MAPPAALRAVGANWTAAGAAQSPQKGHRAHRQCFECHGHREPSRTAGPRDRQRFVHAGTAHRVRHRTRIYCSRPLTTYSEVTRARVGEIGSISCGARRAALLTQQGLRPSPSSLVSCSYAREPEVRQADMIRRHSLVAKGSAASSTAQPLLRSALRQRSRQRSAHRAGGASVGAAW